MAISPGDAEFETDSEYSDGMTDDPTLYALEETCLRVSELSVRRDKKSSIAQMSENDDEESDAEELDEEDQNTFERVQRIIQVGEIERLKLEECKLYLRKHGLRLSGRKEMLIQRIKEHINIINVGGDKIYPISSFVINCKGDACTGDVVMFQQDVYEAFNVAYRGASAPSCGRRVTAGRIVKDSYGSEKQQHTFTIEVLWSKGEKALDPLRLLLIKGRNLYRLKTMRQRWKNEEERKKILEEKHARGDAARTLREARLKRMEMLKPEKKKKQLTRDRGATKGEHDDVEAAVEKKQRAVLRMEVLRQRQPLPTQQRDDSRREQLFPTHQEQQPYRIYGGERWSYGRQKPPLVRMKCRHHAQGRCIFGDRCHFIHEY
ncbi:hypothetical protein M569_12381 [Genlisea aurea]|uniref:C3H1-type domain-containing protein n=1 Tax=Genlisea aurea TaxID=192259 RepID=S8C6K6_9LAMI|nr:hypothetical protein M569_12381 [Genlisea aurea]